MVHVAVVEAMPQENLLHVQEALWGQTALWGLTPQTHGIELGRHVGQILRR